MMLTPMTRNNRGFTIVEIIVVLLLVSIVATVVFQRSISTDQMNFASQFNKIQHQARYPQSMAMKRGEWWGFRSDADDYWIFTGTNENTAANRRLLPGQRDKLISLGDLGVTMDEFTVIFDEYGRPYSPDWTTLMTANEDINLTDSSSESRSFTIVFETGLIR